MTGIRSSIVQDVLMTPGPSWLPGLNSTVYRTEKNIIFVPECWHLDICTQNKPTLLYSCFASDGKLGLIHSVGEILIKNNNRQ